MSQGSDDFSSPLTCTLYEFTSKNASHFNSFSLWWLLNLYLDLFIKLRSGISHCTQHFQICTKHLKLNILQTGLKIDPLSFHQNPLLSQWSSSVYSVIWFIHYSSVLSYHIFNSSPNRFHYKLDIDSNATSSFPLINTSLNYFYILPSVGILA